MEPESSFAIWKGVGLNEDVGRKTDRQGRGLDFHLNLRIDSLIDRRQSWTASHDRTSIHMKDDERLLGTESGGEHLSARSPSAPCKRTHRKFLLSSSLNLYRVRFPWTASFSQWGISLTIDAREFCPREWETSNRVLFARLGDPCTCVDWDTDANWASALARIKGFFLWVSIFQRLLHHLAWKESAEIFRLA